MYKVNRIIPLIASRGYSILLSDKLEYKFKQAEFEGVETIILHPLKAEQIQIPASQGARYLGRYLSYHVLSYDDKTLHIFYDIPSILGWLDSMDSVEYYRMRAALWG